MHSTNSPPLGQTILAPRFDSFPAALRERRQWVLWRAERREGDKPTKVPYQPNGRKASVTDPNTWFTFSEIRRAFDRGGFDGVGFMFTVNDPFVGIDLDGCRDPETGEIAEWACDVIDRCYGTYAEISPSGSGVKLFGLGELPDGKGFNHKLPDQGERGGKGAAVEVYDRKRYFAMTGATLPASDAEPCDVSEGLAHLLSLRDQERQNDEWRPRPLHHDLPENDRRPGSDRHQLLDRCRRYVHQMPEAVSGQSGHNAAFRVACVLFRFGLTDSEAAAELDAYNQRCSPPWSPRELEHKLRSARDTVTREGKFGTMGRDDRHPDWRSSTAVVGGAFDRDETATDDPPRLEFVDAVDLTSQFVTLREPIVEGLLRRGEVANLNAAPKVGKSWLAHDLALSIATGGEFLGQATRRGRVRLVDLELHKETLAYRLQSVAAAKCLRHEDYRGFLGCCAARGEGLDLHRLASRLRNTEDDAFDLLIIDAWYRLIPEGVSENDNGAITNLYNVLDRLAARLDCGIVVIHHTTKGLQSDKSVTDVGAGASAMARAADSHIVIREHEEAGVAVIDAVCRSWPKFHARCLRWTFPLWQLDEEHDPNQLRKPSNVRRTEQDRQRDTQKRLERQEDEEVEKIVAALKLAPNGETQSGLRASTKIKPDRIAKALRRLEGTGHVERVEIKKHTGKYEAFRYIEKPGSLPEKSCRSLSVPDGADTNKDGHGFDCPSRLPFRGAGTDKQQPNVRDDQLSRDHQAGRFEFLDEFNDQGANS